jgi:hypothetical protein
LAWVLSAAVVFFVIVAYVQIRDVMRSGRSARVGDGRDVMSYGFDLEPCLVPRATLVASGMPKATLVPLDTPRLLDAAQVDSLNGAERGKYLVSNDLVIGVVRRGVARAYPVRVLNWHEVANDTIGACPVAVTWHPLCGSSAVFDRRVAAEVLTFGQSGLLANANLLLYDRRQDGASESLWSQLQARAVAGPAAARGDSLLVLPHVLTSWARWRAAYPETTVPLPQPKLRKSYAREPYGAYEGSDLLRFPVDPLPPAGGPRFKQRIVATRTTDGWNVTLHEDNEAPGSVLSDASRPVVHAYWFAWYAAQPQAREFADLPH